MPPPGRLTLAVGGVSSPLERSRQARRPHLLRQEAGHAPKRPVSKPGQTSIARRAIEEFPKRVLVRDVQRAGLGTCIGNRHLDAQLSEADELHRMRAAARPLSNNHHPARLLQCCREVLTSGGGAPVDQHIHRVVRGHRARPGLLNAARPVVGRDHVFRLGEQVALKCQHHPRTGHSVCCAWVDLEQRVVHQPLPCSGSGFSCGVPS